ncbi:MAG: GNAT family N-acetyltransferase [Clostridia bacterium]|nr:GNAT family N-acetyltransferase [Clostridia bacterium]
MIKVASLTEDEIRAVGDAFADFEYAEGEKGMNAYYRDHDAVRDYICDYVRGSLKGGRLYSTSNRHEAYIAFHHSSEKMPIGADWIILRSLIRHLGIRGTINFVKRASASGQSCEDKLKKEKKPYIVVGMVAVTKPYQGQGYMRKVMDSVFEEGKRRNCLVILETDAKLKRDKYVHLGMTCVAERRFDEGSYLYDLVKAPS